MSIERELEVFYRPFVEAKEAADVDLFQRKGITLATVQESVREGFARAELLLHEFRAQAPPPKPLDCRSGCSACCRRCTVSAAPSEVIHLLAVLKTRPDRSAVKERVRTTWEQVRTMDDQDRLAAWVPCPLLVADACSVYEDRPQTCRACNSMDIRYCTRPQGGALAYSYQLMVHRAIHAGLMSAAARVGLENTPVELVSALHIALSHPGTIIEFLRGDSPLAESYAYDAFAV